MKRLSFLTLFAALSLSPVAQAAQLYFNGFETDTLGWSGTDRVASGINGVPSSSGSFHGQKNAGTAFTGWGATATPGDGYNFGAGNGVGVPFQEYTTSIDIYLDVDSPWANNTRLDFSSAISGTDGLHRRDFIFNMGFFDDATGPGANTDRFVISASNNSQPGSAFAKNPDKSPIAISATGWYTFQHRFYDNGLGQLAVDMSIYDSSSSLVNLWTLSDLTDLIDVTVGGNRYGWFDYNEFSVLAYDNASLNVVPEPATLILAGLAVLGLVGVARRRK